MSDGKDKKGHKLPENAPDPIGKAFGKAVDTVKNNPVLTGAAAGLILRGLPGMLIGATLGSKKARQTIANAFSKALEGVSEGFKESNAERQEQDAKNDRNDNTPPKGPSAPK